MADQETYDNGPLLSAYAGAMEYIVPYLKAGGPIDYANSDGLTMLHGAAQGWQHHMIDFLLIWGASLNVQDRYGNTPLHSLVMAREPPGPLRDVEKNASDLTPHRRQSFLSLIRRKPNLTLKNRAGGTPLHLAAWEGDVLALDALLLGIDKAGIDDVSDKGATALLLAVLNNHVACAKRLLASGANINFPISSNRTILNRIKESEDPDMNALSKPIADSTGTRPI